MTANPEHKEDQNNMKSYEQSSFMKARSSIILKSSSNGEKSSRPFQKISIVYYQ